MPVECTPLQEIDITDQQDGHIKHHFYEAEPACLWISGQILKDVSPRKQEYGLDIKQDKDHRHKIKFHRERLAGIPGRCYPAFIRLRFGFTGPPPTNEC